MAKQYGPDTRKLLNCLYTCETILDLTGLNITSLPELPDRIEYLTIDNPRLKTIPNFPASLKMFWCRHTPLRSLSDFPDELEGIYFQGQQLQALPELPHSLTTLICWDAPLLSLPDLPPNLEVLVCTRSNITVLPDLPPKLRHLNYQGSPILLEQKAEETIQDYNARLRVWKVEEASRKRCQERCEAYKEDLISEAMHPRRIERWLDAYGFDVLECI